MKQIEAIIERSGDGTYCVYCRDEMFSGMGDSSEAAQNDMMEQMRFYKKTAMEEGRTYPDFLDGEFEMLYQFDVRSLLEFYSGILSLSGLEKITGIHQKQLWNYLHTATVPRKTQIAKIERGLHRLGKELTGISLRADKS
jgi:predicted RNase H-like HicB family nuclease